LRFDLLSVRFEFSAPTRCRVLDGEFLAVGGEGDRLDRVAERVLAHELQGPGVVLVDRPVLPTISAEPLPEVLRDRRLMVGLHRSQTEVGEPTSSRF
jgi:hypothetical protein